MESKPLLLNRLRLTMKARRFACGVDWKFNLKLVDYDFWLVTSGKGTLSCDGRIYPIEAPQCFVFFQGETVQGTHDLLHPLEVYGFHFFPEPRHAAVDQQLRQLHATRMGFSGTLQEIAEAMIRMGERPDPAAVRTGEHLGLALLSLAWQQKFAAPPLPSDSKIDQVIREIRLYPEKEWEIEIIARKCSLSRTHLTNRFQELTGFSPIQFVIRQRIKKAAELLLETSLSIKEISDACGYSDIFYFTRQFKSVERTTPGRYRSVRLHY